MKTKLAPSSIHGVGVIAIKNIRKGEKCFISPRFEPRFYNVPFSSFNKLLPEVKELILERWASVVNGSIFRSPNDDASLLMFVNHSPDNYNYDVVSDVALRDIRAGEEIFEDYRLMTNWEKVRPVNKNPWLVATNVKKSPLKKNIHVVLTVIKSIWSFARS